MNFQNLYEIKALALANVSPLFVQKLWETPEFKGESLQTLARYKHLHVTVHLYDCPYTPRAATSLAVSKLRVELHLPCGVCQTGYTDGFEIPNDVCINGDLYCAMASSLITAIHAAFCPVGIAELFEHTRREYGLLTQMVA